MGGSAWEEGKVNRTRCIEQPRFHFTVVTLFGGGHGVCVYVCGGGRGGEGPRVLWLPHQSISTHHVCASKENL